MVKNLPANGGDTRDAASVPGWRRFFGEGNGNPRQYSCLENAMGRGAREDYSTWGHKELDMTE